MTSFDLPAPIKDMVIARNELRAHYRNLHLNFTFDGNFVGDIGEAIAATHYGITLAESNKAGIDGVAPDGRTVQVKATGTNRGPAFRATQARADHLLFFSFDFEALKGQLVYNGPEHLVLENFPKTWIGQKSATWNKIVNLGAQVPIELRLNPMDVSKQKTR